MAILKVVQYPDPVLKKICEPVTDFGDQFQKFIDDLLETMYAEDGMGIAANQVAVLKRVFIMDEDPHGGKNPFIFVNPEIVFQSEDQVEDTEGCLSFRGVPVVVMRARKVAVKAFDRHGKEFICEREGYSAKCLQHEYDHLNGITFFDHISALKRKMAEKKLQKYKKVSM
jgi:peptide deformylase